MFQCVCVWRVCGAPFESGAGLDIGNAMGHHALRLHNGLPNLTRAGLFNVELDQR